MTQQYSIDTLLAQAGNRSDERTGAVSTPIYLSTAYGLWHFLFFFSGFHCLGVQIGEHPLQTVLEFQRPSDSAHI